MKLRELRRENGLSQEALGHKLGVGQTSIANYELNKRIPSLENFFEIAKVFNVSLDYLAGTINSNESYKVISEVEMAVEAEKYLELLLKAKKDVGHQYIMELKKHGWDNIDIYKKVFAPVLRKTGDMWENKELSVGEEHFISNTILEIIAHLKSIEPKMSRKKGKILMATVDEEEHMIGLKIMEDILAQEGYDTYFLGSKTSNKHLLESIKGQKPKIIILSITLKKLIINLEKVIPMIKKTFGDQKIKVIVVGQGIKNEYDLIYRFGADACGETFDDVFRMIKKSSDE